MKIIISNVPLALVPLQASHTTLASVCLSQSKKIIFRLPDVTKRKKIIIINKKIKTTTTTTTTWTM